MLECFLSCASPDNNNGSTFRLLAGWGGGLRFTSCAKTESNNGALKRTCETVQANDIP